MSGSASKRAAGCRQVMQLGSEHPDVATTMANTAGLLKALGKHSEAETVYRTVRSLPPQLAAPQNPCECCMCTTFRRCHSDLAICRARQSSESVASLGHPPDRWTPQHRCALHSYAIYRSHVLPWRAQVLEMREAALGGAHPEVAACLNNLAVLLKGAGRHAEAQGMYERCIAIKQQAMGPTHPQVGPPAAWASVWMSFQFCRFCRDMQICGNREWASEVWVMQ